MPTLGLTKMSRWPANSVPASQTVMLRSGLCAEPHLTASAELNQEPQRLSTVALLDLGDSSMNSGWTEGWRRGPAWRHPRQPARHRTNHAGDNGRVGCGTSPAFSPLSSRGLFGSLGVAGVRHAVEAVSTGAACRRPSAPLANVMAWSRER